MSQFDLAIPVVLHHEGGFSQDPQDPGGATSFGISLRWLMSIGDMDHDGYQDGDLNHDYQVNLEDIKKITQNEAMQFYREYWWDKYHYEKINDQSLATKTFDLAVNMGAHAAHRCLQRAIRAVSGICLPEDGILGDKTINTINSIPANLLIVAYKSEAAGFYRTLRKPHYERGWLNRAYA